MADAVHQGVPLVDEGGSQLGGVDLSGTHGHKLVALVGEKFLHNLVRIADDSHGGDGEQAQVGAHQQGLGVGVADAADTAAAVELGDILLEFRAEGSIFNIVNLPLEAAFLIIDNHAAPAGTQMGVIVHAEKDVENAVPLGDRSKKTAQNMILLIYYAVQGTMPAGRPLRR